MQVLLLFFSVFTKTRITALWLDAYISQSMSVHIYIIYVVTNKDLGHKVQQKKHLKLVFQKISKVSQKAYP